MRIAQVSGDGFHLPFFGVGSIIISLFISTLFASPFPIPQDTSQSVPPDSNATVLVPGGGDTLSHPMPPEDSLQHDSLSRATSSDTLPFYHLDRSITNNAFRVGEKLTFKVRYGIIKAGQATMEVKERVKLPDSSEAYHIISTARSSGAFDIFYKVRDSVQTFLDVNGFFSRRFKKQLREGGYKYDLFVDYDQRHGIANVQTIRYYNEEPLRVKKKETFQLKVPAYVLDVLAAFYYVRTQELRVGEPIYMTNHDNKKVYDLQVIIQRKERVKVKAGKFNCIVISPRLRGEAIFKQKGELWIWLTDDQYKIPVQMKSKVVVGSITTELIKIEGVPTPIPAQVK